jgi:hypothetical protein
LIVEVHNGVLLLVPSNMLRKPTTHPPLNW